MLKLSHIPNGLFIWLCGRTSFGSVEFVTRPTLARHLLGLSLDLGPSGPSFGAHNMFELRMQNPERSRSGVGDHQQMALFIYFFSSKFLCFHGSQHPYI